MHKLTAEMLQEIFTLEHPSYRCTPVVVDQGNQYWINGTITTNDGASAGSFTRSIVQKNGELVALHDNFTVVEAFRRQGIAKSHYKKAFRGYIEIGCFMVEMYAMEYGTFVWPVFGFQYTRSSDKEAVTRALAELYEAQAGCPIPRIPTEEYAMILTQAPNGVEVGADAAQRTALRHENGALEMRLDLRDGPTRGYLATSGILDP